MPSTNRKLFWCSIFSKWYDICPALNLFNHSDPHLRNKEEEQIFVQNDHYSFKLYMVARGSLICSSQVLSEWNIMHWANPVFFTSIIWSMARLFNSYPFIGNEHAWVCDSHEEIQVWVSYYRMPALISTFCN